jgi:hypothetical protein
VTREIPWRGWAAFGVSSLAVLYGIWFLVWAVLAPDYPGGEIGPLTYAEVDVVKSAKDLLLPAQSLLVAVPAWFLLHRYCSTGESWAGKTAKWLAVGLLFYAFIGGFTIAHGTFPAACLLIVAVLLTPRGGVAATAAKT